MAGGGRGSEGEGVVEGTLAVARNHPVSVLNQEGPPDGNLIPRVGLRTVSSGVLIEDLHYDE